MTQAAIMGFNMQCVPRWASLGLHYQEPPILEIGSDLVIDGLILLIRQ
jgi:hypothetical protein